MIYLKIPIDGINNTGGKEYLEVSMFSIILTQIYLGIWGDYKQ